MNSQCRSGYNKFPSPYSIINFNAEEDNCTELSLGTVNSKPHIAIVKVLKEISKEIRARISEHKGIKSADDEVIIGVVQEAKGNGEGTDGGDGGRGDSSDDESTRGPAPFNFGKIKDHLMGVFREMFSKEELLKSEPAWLARAIYL